MIILRVLMGRAWSKEATTIPQSESQGARLSTITVPSPNNNRFTYNSEGTAVNLKTLSSSPSKISVSREWRESKTVCDLPPSPSSWTFGTTIGAAL